MLVGINRTSMDMTGNQIHITIENKVIVRIKRKDLEAIKLSGGGGRGIRTPDDREAITDFKSAGFNHSPIPPKGQTFLDGFPGGLKPFRRSVCWKKGLLIDVEGFFQHFEGVEAGFGITSCTLGEWHEIVQHLGHGYFQ